MKKSEVPQDESFLSKNNITELYYALDDEGNYTTEQSKGWEAKTIIQNETMNVLNERIAEAKQKVASGEWSPIVYFMELNRMDWQTLAGYMGTWTWLIKRHVKPQKFKSLKTKTLEKYADIFNISVNELKNFNGK